MKLGELGACLKDSSRLPDISVSLSCIHISQLSLHHYCCCTSNSDYIS